MKKDFLNTVKAIVFLLALFTVSGFAVAQTGASNRAEPIILWWTDTSAPAWYEGKQLASTGSTATIYALPGTGYGAGAANLFYSWNINAESQPKISGIGKRTFTIAVSQAENVIHHITVRISSPDGTVKKEASLLLQTERPRLFVYPLMATGGIAVPTTVTNFTGGGGETFEFLAVPFFFRLEEANALSFEWRLNGGLMPTFTDRAVLVSDPGETSDNTVTVSARQGGTNVLLPHAAQTSFNISFR